MERTKILSLKELFERLIVLETKLDMITVNDKSTKDRFTVYVAILLTLELINIFLQFLI